MVLSLAQAGWVQVGQMPLYVTVGQGVVVGEGPGGATVMVVS